MSTCGWPRAYTLRPTSTPAAKSSTLRANSAIEQGYRLKIYDSYRPNRATRDIYDKAEVLANEPVPELDIYGRGARGPA